jgi:site-specific DNA-adenine methylase
MFSYYGSKSKIVNLYPPPKYSKIIEPFAGSARYALKYFDREVLLVDKYETVVDVWKYLQQASIADINKLPRLQKGEVIPEGLSDIEKKFMGFIVADGAAAPQNKTTSFSSNPDKVKARLQSIAKQLFKIKHWEIRLGCYKDIENVTATWFIDPPYQFGGQHYKESNKNLNFTELAEWCRSRNGQTIVCENSKADWLPFKKVIKTKGQKPTMTTEVIFSNEKTNYDNEQILLQF